MKSSFIHIKRQSAVELLRLMCNLSAEINSQLDDTERKEVGIEALRIENAILRKQLSDRDTQMDAQEAEMHLLNSPITDFDLSVRAMNCLKAADINTLGDLLSRHRSDLIRLRNFGRHTLAEIEELVEKLGYHLYP